MNSVAEEEGERGQVHSFKGFEGCELVFEFVRLRVHFVSRVLLW